MLYLPLLTVPGFNCFGWPAGNTLSRDFLFNLADEVLNVLKLLLLIKPILADLNIIGALNCNPLCKLAIVSRSW